MFQQRFTNPWSHESHGFLDILSWKLGIAHRERAVIADAGNAPAAWQPLPRETTQSIPDRGWRVAWLGHSSFLVQGCGVNLLIDPVFADYCSPIPIWPLRRKVPTPCTIRDLPDIHAVLITHVHYDHLDLATLRKLGDQTRIIIAEGHAAWLAGKLRRPVTELRWQESIALNQEVTVTATPAQHFSARTAFDRNKGHWCGWLIEGGGCTLWHAGDSGYCSAFRDMGDRYGSIDFAMIPIGAYQPSSIMKPMHMNPEEAVQAFQDARCRRAVAMHWGTFALTDEPMQEPPMRLRRELERKSLPLDAFTAENIGSTWTVIPRQGSGG